MTTPTPSEVLADELYTCNPYIEPGTAAGLMHRTAALLRAGPPEETVEQPNGMVLVPREATAEMVQAMEDRQIEGATYIAENSIQFALWKEVWRAAIAAASSGGKEG